MNIKLEGLNNSSIELELAGKKWAKFKDLAGNIYLIDKNGKIYDGNHGSPKIKIEIDAQSNQNYKHIKIEAEIDAKSLEYIDYTGNPFVKKTIYKIEKLITRDGAAIIRDGVIYCTKEETDKDAISTYPILTKEDMLEGKNAVVIKYKHDVKYVIFLSKDKKELIVRLLSDPKQEHRFGNSCMIAELDGEGLRSTYGVAVKYNSKENKIISNTVNLSFNTIPFSIIRDSKSAPAPTPQPKNPTDESLIEQKDNFVELNSGETARRVIEHLFDKLKTNKINLRKGEEVKLNEIIQKGVTISSTLLTAEDIIQNIDKFFAGNQNDKDKVFAKRSIDYFQDFIGSLIEFLTRLFNGERIWGIDGKGVDHRMHVVDNTQTFVERLTANTNAPNIRTQ